MEGVQLYNPVDGLGRMITDVERLLSPFIYGLQPVIRIFSILNFYLILLVFLGLLAYMIFIRQHSVMKKLKRPTNYFAAMILLGIYLFLTAAPLRLGEDPLGQEITLGLDCVIMPMAVKLLGPVVGCFFGMIQYGASFMIRNETFNLSYMLVAGISAMIYGRFLYQRKTKYLRCFTTKLLVNIVCNVILVPFLEGNEMTPEVTNAITNRIVLQIIFAPIQAAAIYVGLIIMRKLRKVLSEVSWSL